MTQQPLKGDTLDKLAFIRKRQPIDANAATDVFHPRTADPFEVPNVNGFEHSHGGPIATRSVPRGTVDLTARTFGKTLTVIGLYRWPEHYNAGALHQTHKGFKAAKRSGLLWVCKCQCGCYETRHISAINNKRNLMDCCYHCRKLRRIQNAEHFRQTGEYTCSACGHRTREKGYRCCG